MINGKSQYNEDSIIENIFNKINIYKGTYFEIGVNNKSFDGSIQCNSIKLINEGWTGNLVDSTFEHPLVIKKFISTSNLEEVATLAGQRINFFSIDIDSYDWHIVKDLLVKNIVDVDVFCVETNNYNGHCFLDRVLKLDAPAPNTKGWPKSDSFGAATFSYNLLMEKFNYKLIATSHHGVNAFFVHNKFANLFSKTINFDELYIDSNDLINNWSKKGPDQFMTTADLLLKYI